PQALLNRTVRQHWFLYRWGSDWRIHNIADRPRSVGSRRRSLVPLAEYHLSCRGLKHRGDGDIDIFADHLSRIVNHDHGAIIEVSDALVVFLAFLQNENFHRLAGKNDRFQGVSQLVNIKHVDTLELGYFVEIEIVGDDFAFIQFR